MPETQDKESPQGLVVSPQLLIRRERVRAVFSSNEYGILGSFLFFFKSTHQAGSVYNLSSPRNPRIREVEPVAQRPTFAKSKSSIWTQLRPTLFLSTICAAGSKVWERRPIEAFRLQGHHSPSHTLLTCSGQRILKFSKVPWQTCLLSSHRAGFLPLGRLQRVPTSSPGCDLPLRFLTKVSFKELLTVWIRGHSWGSQDTRERYNNRWRGEGRNDVGMGSGERRERRERGLIIIHWEHLDNPVQRCLLLGFQNFWSLGICNNGNLEGPNLRAREQ